MPLMRRLTAGAKGQAIVNMGLQLVSTALGFVSSVLMSRLLGADGLGVYAFCFAVGNVVGVIGRFGLQTLMVREIAVALERKQLDLVHGMARWGEGTSVALSTAASVLMALVGWWLWSSSDPSTAITLCFTGLLVMATTGLSIRAAALQGLHQSTAGQFAGLGVRPVVFVLLLLALFWRESAEPWMAITAHAMGYAVGWVVAFALWYRLRPAWSSPRYMPRAWATSAAPLVLLATLNLLNTQADILMLKVLHGNSATGVYHVTSQLAHFTGLLLAVVNIVIAPRLAALHARGALDELQRVVTRSATAVTLGTLPVALLLMTLAPTILAVWGPSFVEGAPSLVVLVLGQIVNVVCGSVGTILVMSGHERVVGVVTTGTALLNVALNLALIPHFGATGAAMATSTSLTLWNVLLASRVRTLLGLDSTILRAFSQRPH